MPSVIALGKLLLGALVLSSGQTIQQCPANQQSVAVIYENRAGAQSLFPACIERDKDGKQFLSYPANVNFNPQACGYEITDGVTGENFVYLKEKSPGALCRQ